MDFFNSAVEVLQTLVVALGAGLGVWGVINLLEGYGNDNPGAKSQGVVCSADKQMGGFGRLYIKAAGSPPSNQWSDDKRNFKSTNIMML